MTKGIKQWVSIEAAAIGTTPGFSGEVLSYHRQLGAISGLTKGIEIAEGFAEWAEDLYIQEEKGRWYEYGMLADEPVVFFTTSQLIEKYLEYLKSIENKEK